MTQVVVLIDLHQLNVKTTSDNTKSATLNTGQPHVNEEQNLQNNNLQHLPNQMIEQINIALEQKVRYPQPGHSLPSETNVRKESIYIN